MLVYLTHPKHGTHIVYDPTELQACLKSGWVRSDEPKAPVAHVALAQEAPVVDTPKRRGRPPKK